MQFPWRIRGSRFRSRVSKSEVWSRFWRSGSNVVPKSAIRFQFHDMRSPFKKCSSHEGYVVPVYHHVPYGQTNSTLKSCNYLDNIISCQERYLWHVRPYCLNLYQFRFKYKDETGTSKADLRRDSQTLVIRRIYNIKSYMRFLYLFNLWILNDK